MHRNEGEGTSTVQMKSSSPEAYRLLFANDVPVLAKSLRIIHKVRERERERERFGEVAARDSEQSCS